MAKSLNVSYALWLMFGPLGIHHIYLGRDFQWFLWFSSLGGFFVGFVSDLCKLPSFVSQRNQSPVYLEGWDKRKGTKVHEWQLARWIGAYLFSGYYELIGVLALDSYLSHRSSLYWILFAVKALMRAVAVYACFCVGEKQTSFRHVCLVSYLSEVVLCVTSLCLLSKDKNIPSHFIGEPDMATFSFSQMPFVATATTAYIFQRYRTQLNTNKHVCYRLPLILLAATGWMLLMGSAVYNHLDVPTSSDKPFQTRKVREVLTEFVQSDSYRNLRKAGLEFKHLWHQHGFFYAGESLARHYLGDMSDVIGTSWPGGWDIQEEERRFKVIRDLNLEREGHSKVGLDFQTPTSVSTCKSQEVVGVEQHKPSKCASTVAVMVDQIGHKQPVDQCPNKADIQRELFLNSHCEILPFS